MDNSNNKMNRQRKKRGGISIRTAAVIILLTIGVLFGVMLMIPAFNITEVYCEGESLISNEDIITTANIKNGTNILLANIGAARRSIQKMPMVKNVKIRRVFPNKICISVETRTPAAYVMTGGGCVLIDCDGTVLENTPSEKSARIIERNTPKFDVQTAITENSDKSDSNNSNNSNKNNSTDNSDNNGDKNSDNNSNKNSDDTDKSSDKNSDSNNKDSSNSNNSNSNNDDNNSKDNNNKDSNAENGGADSANTEGEDNGFSVPLTAGLELNNKDEGKAAQADDSRKLDKLLEMCNALNDAGLLNRSTYIDLTDLGDVSMVIENRLDIKLGIPDNMEYRAKFLAETINTKISSTEVLILDYTGNDIYARPHEDGKDRVNKKFRKSEEDKNKSKNDNKSGSDSSNGESSTDNSKNQNQDNSGTTQKSDSGDDNSSTRKKSDSESSGSQNSANNAARDTEL